jgi:hypothetical protein
MNNTLFDIDGYFILEKNVYDTDAFEEKHRDVIRQIVRKFTQANDNEYEHLFVSFGCTKDHLGVCEFEIIKETEEDASIYKNLLKSMLIKEFPSMEEHIVFDPIYIESTDWYDPECIDNPWDIDDSWGKE